MTLSTWRTLALALVLLVAGAPLAAGAVLDDPPSVSDPCVFVTLSQPIPEPSDKANASRIVREKVGYKVEMDGLAVSRHYPPDCSRPTVDAGWRFNTLWGEGEINFSVPSPLGNVFSIERFPQPPSPLDPLVPSDVPLVSSIEDTTQDPAGAAISVTIRYQATLRPTACQQTEGGFWATVNGQPLDVAPPPGFFAGLCKGSISPPEDDRTLAFVDLTAAAVGEVARVVARDVGPASAVPFEALARALASLVAPSVEAPRVDAPATPDAPVLDPEDGVATAGDATAFLAPGSGSAAASENATVEAFGVDITESKALAVGDAPAPWADVAVPLGAEASAPAAQPDQKEAASGIRKPLGAIDDGHATLAPASSQDAPPSALTVEGVHLVAHPSSAAAWGPRGTAAVAAGAGLLTLVGWALYQRFLRPRALDQPTRNAVYEACRASPAGIAAAEVAARVGITRKAAEYHLVYLARLGILREVRASGRRRSFALPAQAPRDEPGTPLAARVLAHVRSHPGVSAPALADALDVTRTHLDRYLKELLLRGRIESRVEAGTRLLFPADVR